MKLRFLLAAAISLVLAGCDYCPQPGYLSWVPAHCKPKAPAYPIPDMSPGKAAPTGAPVMAAPAPPPPVQY